MTEDFFDAASGASLAKSQIVFDYFKAWARIILPRSGGVIRYMDLFCGPGVYADGTESTPMLIVRHAIADLALREALATTFNDADAMTCGSLLVALNGVAGIRSLTHQPDFSVRTIDQDLAAALGRIKLVPTLLFIDPWGYKGLSLDLVNAVLKDWACECLFFFNYNRVNAAMTNPRVVANVDGIFGEERADALRAAVPRLTPSEREALVVRTLMEAVVEEHNGHALAFKFPAEDANRTSHFLVFVTKHRLGYDIMKDIMAKAGTTTPDGVPTYEYAEPMKPQQFGLFDGEQIADLMQELASVFVGQTMTVKSIIERHRYGRPFVPRNYKAALMAMERQGLVVASRPLDQRRANTLADDIQITFVAPGAH